MIVELQGILESSQTGGYNGLPIGDLHFDEKVRCKFVLIFFFYLIISPKFNIDY
jgi:hypothetical protein